MSRTNDPLALPSVAEVLLLNEISEGSPQVFASDESLEKRVRWVHVLTEPSAAELLEGGELLLTTGSGWPSLPEEISELAANLISAGVSAIALELGKNFSSAPEALTSACLKRGVPLIVLNREVRFAQITQRIHRRILSAQAEALEARAEIHSMLTELGLNRSPVDYTIQQLSGVLSCPIILENISSEMVAWATDSPAKNTAEVLSEWETFKKLGSVQTDLEPAISVRIEARGTLFGKLTALPGPPHPANRLTVLELGAFALALARLSDPAGTDWLRLSSRRLLDTLLSGRYRHDSELSTQLTASGFPVDGRTMLAVAFTGRGSFGSHTSLEKAVLETALRRSVSPEGKIILADSHDIVPTDFSGPSGQANSIIGLVSFPQGDKRADFFGDEVPRLVAELSRELEMLVPTTTPSQWRAHLSLGVSGVGVSGLLSSAEGLLRAGVLPASISLGRIDAQIQNRQPLSYLLRSFQGSPEMQTYVQDLLGPILEHDRMSGTGHSGDLLRVLGAYLKHPTNRSLAASRARLSRSVFYQRIDLIEEILGVDLNDGDTIVSLGVALSAHGL